MSMYIGTHSKIIMKFNELGKRSSLMTVRSKTISYVLNKTVSVVLTNVCRPNHQIALKFGTCGV